MSDDKDLKSKKDKSRSAPDPQEIELHPDAWERFERAVDKVAKSPPQHRMAKRPPALRKKLPVDER